MKHYLTPQNTVFGIDTTPPNDWVEITIEQAREHGQPAMPAPRITKVTMRQARLALLGAGKLPAVNAAIAAMEGAQGEAARIEWEYSQEVQRDRGLVLALGAQLGMTEQQLDELFTAAAKL